MRKSNWIIIGILVVASLFFMWLWFFLGLNAVDSPFDLILTIVWWVIIIAICVAIHVVEKQRQESLRTIFLAPGIVYNRERGAVRIAPGNPIVPVMQNILTEMKYGFDYYDEPDSDAIRFKYIVQTTKFEKNGGVWEGEVIDVSRPSKFQKFTDRSELEALLPVNADLSPRI